MHGSVMVLPVWANHDKLIPCPTVAEYANYPLLATGELCRIDP